MTLRKALLILPLTTAMRNPYSIDLIPDSVLYYHMLPTLDWKSFTQLAATGRRYRAFKMEYPELALQILRRQFPENTFLYSIREGVEDFRLLSRLYRLEEVDFESILRTILHADNREALIWLLDNHEAEVRDFRWIYMALSDGKVEIARWLGSLEDLIDHPPVQIATWSIRDDRVDVLRWIDERYTFNNDYQEFLAEAGHFGAVQCLAYLIDEKNADINGPYRSALTNACRAGHELVVGALIQRNAQVNDIVKGPLRAAVTHGHANIVTMLLEAGAEADDGILSTAVQFRHGQVVRILLQHGVRPGELTKRFIPLVDSEINQMLSDDIG